MPYDNLGGVRGSYVDGSLLIPRTTNQPRVLVIGPASKGRTNEIFTVVNSGDAESEFGASSAVMRGVHEVLAQRANNVAIMRSGGTPGSITLTDTSANSVTVTPSQNDDQVLARYAVVVENDGTSNRFMVYDLVDDEWVYDSDEILVLDEGVVEVVGLDDIVDLWQVNDRTSPATAIACDVLVVGDFDTSGANVAPSAIATVAGTDGTAPALVERYAAYNTSYFTLDYKDADYILPMDVYIDDLNIADDLPDNQVGDPSSATTPAGEYGLFWSGVPAAASTQDQLGFLWQYVFQGKLYTYFVDTSDYASDTPVAATGTLATDITVTCAVGKGGNGVTVEIVDTGSGGETQSLTEAGDGTMTVTIDLGGTTPNRDALVGTSNTAFASITTAGGKTLSSLVVLSGGTAAAAGADSVTCTGGQGGAALTPADLEGMTIPAGVSSKFTAAVDAEFRECNFAHQLGTACEVASSTWQAVQGAIAFKAPESYGRCQLASHFGSLPTYTDNGRQLYVGATADNGSGVLGNKFVAGKADSAGGYRAGRINDGSASDSYAYGGLIKTQGSALPNGTEWPYGINDADEATDENNAPVDLGKFLFICADWIVHRNSYNGGSVYRGSNASTLLGVLAVLPENLEPIGENGRVLKVTLGRRIHSTQLDSLARLRVVMLRREEGGGIGITFTTGRTGAHPVDSDYTRSSTQRCVNRHLEGIRDIARPYIGRPFTSLSLTALEAAVQRYLQQERIDGYNDGAVARLSYTRGSKILGRLTVTLKMVPPGSIEAITVKTTLAADESELI